MTLRVTLTRIVFVWSTCYELIRSGLIEVILLSRSTCIITYSEKSTLRLRAQISMSKLQRTNKRCRDKEDDNDDPNVRQCIDGNAVYKGK